MSVKPEIASSSEVPDQSLSQKEPADRLRLFMAGREFKALAPEGLKLLGRKKKLTNDEFWAREFKSIWSSDSYQEWLRRLERAANSAGVLGPTAELAALQQKFDPGQIPISPTWPVVRLIAHSNDPVFGKAFDYHSRVVAKEMGLTLQVAFIGGQITLNGYGDGIVTQGAWRLWQQAVG